MEFIWTMHSRQKMKYYGLSEQRVKRVVNNSKRKEMGIAPNTIACMQQAGSKKKGYEIWAMYQTIIPKKSQKKSFLLLNLNKKIKIITAWKYPGKSPEKGPIPIPIEIMEELGMATENETPTL